MKKKSNPFKIKLNYQPMGDQPAAIKELSKNFLAGEKYQTLLGVTGSGKTFTMANVIQKLGKKTLIIAPNKTLAAQLFSEFKEFFPENAVEYFVSFYDYYRPEAYVPGSDTYIEKDSAINDEIDKLRHSATKSIFEREDVIVVASVSCIYGIGNPDEYFNNRITIFHNEKKDRDDFLRELVAIQYTRNDTDFKRGNFRVRGDIVEVFPAYEDSKVVRVEFFDDVIDQITFVDPLTSKQLGTSMRLDIYPKSHYVVGSTKLKAAIKNIQEELRHRLEVLTKENKLVEAQRLQQRTLLDIEMLEETGFCNGIENYSRHLSGAKEGDAPSTLIDYFKKDFLIIADESHIAIPQIGAMYKGDRARKMNLVDYGFRLPSALDNRPLRFEEFETKLDQVLLVSATPANYELEKTNGVYVEQVIRPTGLLDPLIEVKNAKTQVDDLLKESKKEIAKGGRVLITTLTKALSEELSDFYTKAGMKVKYLHSEIDTLQRIEIIQDLRMGVFDILIGINLLREGLDIPEVSLVGILDADKEGFLRSTRSLIQTIGRAARNQNGRVILYAYKTTASMNEAITVTKNRRIKQTAFNLLHGITPTTINKKISGGVIEILRGNKKLTKKKKGAVVEELLSAEAIDRKILELKNEMKQAAKELRFEEASKLRDEVKKLTELRFMV